MGGPAFGVALFLVLISSGAISPTESAGVFTLVNECKTTIWPAIMPGQNFTGSLVLKPRETVVFNAPASWSGRIWGRTGCSFDTSGNGMCDTGRCGTSLRCVGSGEPPATLAEFTLGKLDFYDVSLVDGFNLPLVVTPVNGQGGNCSAAGCDGDLRDDCPKELAVKVDGNTVACRSACDVFNTDEYCCRGQFGNPSTCKPTAYSKKFKEACPTAYSYAYDDPSSILTCSGADYIIAFCSNRKNPLCTYHDNKLVCSGSNGLTTLLSKSMLVFLLCIVSLWFYV